MSIKKEESRILFHRSRYKKKKIQIDSSIPDSWHKREQIRKAIKSFRKFQDVLRRELPGLERYEIK